MENTAHARAPFEQAVLDLGKNIGWITKYAFVAGIVSLLSNMLFETDFDLVYAVVGCIAGLVLAILLLAKTKPHESQVLSYVAGAKFGYLIGLVVLSMASLLMMAVYVDRFFEERMLDDASFTSVFCGGLGVELSGVLILLASLLRHVYARQHE